MPRSQTGACLPRDAVSLFSTYMALTGPTQCPAAPASGTQSCADPAAPPNAPPKCTLDPLSPSSSPTCKVDHEFVLRALGGAAAGGAVAAAAQRAQLACSPETNWPDSRELAPRPWGPSACAAMGSFSLEGHRLAELAEPMLPPPGAVGLDGELQQEVAGKEKDPGAESLALRIAGVFIVLGAGVAGTVSPMVFTRVLRRPLVSALLRSLSGGVILALALAHIIALSVSQLDGLAEGAAFYRLKLADSSPGAGTAAAVTAAVGHRRLLRELVQAAAGGWVEAGDAVAATVKKDRFAGATEEKVFFPLGMSAAMVGFLLMVLLEHCTHTFAAKKTAEAGGKAVVGGACCPGRPAAPAGPAAAAIAVPVADSTHDLSAAACTELAVAPSPSKLQSADAASCCEHLPHAQPHACLTLAAEPELAAAPSPDASVASDLVPAELAKVSASAAAIDSNDPRLEPFRAVSLALLFELGCIFHSVFVGMTLGTALDAASARGLLIVLVLHQGVEGLSLGIILVDAGFSLARMLAMAFTYSITCPVGVAIGIGIAAGYDGMSPTTRAVSGTINGVSGGMLLYLAMVLVLGEFGVHTLDRLRLRDRLLSFAVMCVGAAGFAVLAKWA